MDEQSQDWRNVNEFRTGIEHQYTCWDVNHQQISCSDVYDEAETKVELQNAVLDLRGKYRRHTC
jgi:hypothetical protein